MQIGELFKREPITISDPGPSRHQGEVGKRGEFILSCTGIIPIEGGWYVKLYKFQDLKKNEFTYWAGKDAAYELGITYRVRATVKRHGQYQGIQQTVIMRPKIIGLYIAPVEKPRTTDEQLPIHETRESVAELWNDL